MAFQRTFLTKTVVVFAVLLTVAVASAWSSAAAQESQPASKTLRLFVSYTGTGTVDPEHRIHAFVFDTPQINAGSMPIAWDSTSSSGTPMVFTVSQPSVWVAVVFDKEGGYNPSVGPPLPGTPVALYSPTDPNGPTAISFGDRQELDVKFSFDDSILMP